MISSVFDIFGVSCCKGNGFYYIIHKIVLKEG